MIQFPKLQWKSDGSKLLNFFETFYGDEPAFYVNRFEQFSSKTKKTKYWYVNSIPGISHDYYGYRDIDSVELTTNSISEGNYYVKGMTSSYVYNLYPRTLILLRKTKRFMKYNFTLLNFINSIDDYQYEHQGEYPENKDIRKIEFYISGGIYYDGKQSLYYANKIVTSEKNLNRDPNDYTIKIFDLTSIFNSQNSVDEKKYANISIKNLGFFEGNVNNYNDSVDSVDSADSADSADSKDSLFNVTFFSMYNIVKIRDLNSKIKLIWFDLKSSQSHYLSQSLDKEILDGIIHIKHKDEIMKLHMFLVAYLFRKDTDHFLSKFLSKDFKEEKEFIVDDILVFLPFTNETGPQITRKIIASWVGGNFLGIHPIFLGFFNLTNFFDYKFFYTYYNLCDFLNMKIMKNYLDSLIKIFPLYKDLLEL